MGLAVSTGTNLHASTLKINALSVCVADIVMITQQSSLVFKGLAKLMSGCTDVAGINNRGP